MSDNDSNVDSESESDNDACENYNLFMRSSSEDPLVRAMIRTLREERLHILEMFLGCSAVGTFDARYERVQKLYAESRSGDPYAEGQYVFERAFLDETNYPLCTYTMDEMRKAIEYGTHVVADISLALKHMIISHAGKPEADELMKISAELGYNLEPRGWYDQPRSNLAARYGRGSVFMRNIWLIPTFINIHMYASHYIIDKDNERRVEVIPLTKNMINVVDIYLLKELMRTDQKYGVALWCIHFHYLARHINDRVYEFSEELFDDEEHALARYYTELTGESASFNISPYFIYDEDEVILGVESCVAGWKSIHVNW